MSSHVTYSIVIPVYNNQEGIAILVDTVFSTFSTMSFELILVDDFSTDLTWNQLKNKKQEFADLKINMNFNVKEFDRSFAKYNF